VTELGAEEVRLTPGERVWVQARGEWGRVVTVNEGTTAIVELDSGEEVASEHVVTEEEMHADALDDDVCDDLAGGRAVTTFARGDSVCHEGRGWGVFEGRDEVHEADAWVRFGDEADAVRVSADLLVGERELEREAYEDAMSLPVEDVAEDDDEVCDDLV
jgi:hypothetical protein